MQRVSKFQRRSSCHAGPRIFLFASPTKKSLASQLTATVEPFLPTPPVKITEKIVYKFANAQITVIAPIKYLNSKPSINGICKKRFHCTPNILNPFFYIPEFFSSSKIFSSTINF